MSASTALAFDRSARTFDADGRLHVAVTNISKAAVNPYYGREIPNAEGLGLDPNTVYYLFRDPSELYKAAATFNNVPLLRRHVPVSADEPMKEDVVGSTGTDAHFDGIYLQNSIVVWDNEAIAGIETGDQRELSCGYRYTPVLEDGVYGSLTYSIKMTDIVANHVALVEAGRAGPDVVVGDSKLETDHMAAKPLTSRKALMVKGALTSVLAPLLAQDAKLDLGKVLTDVTAKNFAAKKAGILKAITPTLAADADPDAVKLALDAMEDMDDGAEDECETPKAEDEDPDKKAEDEDPDDKKAEDEEPEMKPKGMDKKAMDAAIASAVKAVETSTVARFNAVRDAERAVRPFVGDVFGMDSADDIYKYALDQLKVDTDGVHPSAFPALLKMAPKPGDRPANPRLGMDAASNDDFNKRFPGAARIRTA